MSRRILAVLGSLACASAAARAQGWGTAPGSTTLMAHDFSAEYGVSSEPGTTAPIVQYLGATWCAEPYGTPDLAYRANGQVQVPDGAALSQLQIWAYDIDAADGLTVELWETCQPPGLNAPASTLLGSVDSVGAIGTFFGFTPLNGHRVDNANCAYTARVNFNPGSVCKGSAIQLQKVQVAWTRDVAPAPAAATFGDVSTSHPFFQYVEALVASGVTGGCGGGNYCPDAPLTRGQMAVFLAKALGLEWP